MFEVYCDFFSEDSMFFKDCVHFYGFVEYGGDVFIVSVFWRVFGFWAELSECL